MLHAVLTAWAWGQPQVGALEGRLGFDPLGLLFLTIISVLFLASAVYALGYLRAEDSSGHVDPVEGLLYTNDPEANFVGGLLLFLSSMTLVTASQHFGLLWVGVEARPLAGARLIYFHQHHRSLEAAWKYILICSVGIALALVGNFLRAVAAGPRDGGHAGLVVADLIAGAGQMDPLWLKAVFLFFLVGYGTKMGLVPLHTWLPDAHSESPSLVSALLSGALLNCAFLGILRAHFLCVAAGVADFSQELLVVFGLLSMAVAAVFIVRQADFKRMLAYSSVEHMGVLALGVGLGGVGAFGSILHALNHSFTKAALFLVAGNILGAYQTKSTTGVSGVLRVLPISGVLWVAGFLSITGSPPFGTFLSEFTILKAALDAGRYGTAALYLVFLSLIFIGIVSVVMRMAQGEPPAGVSVGQREPLWSFAPSAVLATLVLMLGLYVAPPIMTALETASVQLTDSQPDQESVHADGLFASGPATLAEVERPISGTDLAIAGGN